jgi:hypothetical protein
VQSSPAFVPHDLLFSVEDDLESFEDPLSSVVPQAVKLNPAQHIATPAISLVLNCTFRLLFPNSRSGFWRIVQPNE